MRIYRASATLKLVALSASMFFNTACDALAMVMEDPQGVKESVFITEDEIVRGLKEALEVGARNAARSTSKVDGFYKNNLIKIPFPEEASKVEDKVRSLGLDKEVDEFVLTMNRGAELAAEEAAPIFVEAIKNMTVTDGVKILNSEQNDAATQYLRNATSAELYAKFLPIVQKSLQEVDVTKYWNPIITTYNKIPFITKQNPDLDAYVTQKAIDGLFVMIAKEEANIRENPQARVTDLLKKVFGRQ